MPRPLRGRYQTLGVVGAGAQGEVLCARDLVHDRLVAVKVRRPSSSAEQDELLAEARTLLQIRPHAGIALAREDFVVAGRYCLVMDWVQGVDLAQWLADSISNGVTYTDVVRVLGQVADALDHLHAHGPSVVHKDVKPANILIDRDGNAVLVDFGLARLRATPHRRGGTPGYRAPEVSAGEGATAASDVFSLAATAYFMFTGAPPEPGGTASWRLVPPALVPRVEAVLARGLALDPLRRPASARGLVELLAPPVAPNNLPAPLTRFVGRDRELSDMARVLRGTRLLTLTGIGGVGKTRLGIELAAQESWAFPGGAWLIELGPLDDDALVLPALAKAMGVQEAPGRSLIDIVADGLRDQRVIVVLDNCEHLLDAAANAAELLLKSAPELRIIATSRQGLDVFGEVAYPVLPLRAPEPRSSLTPEDVALYESVVLFCERAVAADPQFSLDARTAGGVAAVCDRLDGIPLALEMAAARLRELPLDELAATLTTRVELTGARTAPSRQRTLNATFAWSYELLASPAATLFRRLSVFAGGFSAEAAVSVCADEALPASQIDVLLRDLVVCSMVAGEGSRYRLLDTLRQFGADRLAEGEGTERFADRHLAWFLSWAEGRASEFFGPSEGHVLDLLERDMPNLRLALRRALDLGDTEAALRLARAVSRFWNVRAYWSEGRGWLQEVIAVAGDAPSGIRAATLAACAVMAENQGDFQAATRLGQESLRLAEQVDDGATAAEALNSLSNVAQAQGDRGLSDRLLEQCLAAWRSAGTVRGTVSSFAGALGALGWRAAWRGQHAEARRLFEEAMTVAGRLRIRRARVNCLMGLATVAQSEGALDEARRHVDEARMISRELGDKRFLGMQALLDGLIALDDGDDDEATVYLGAALREAVAAGDQVLFLRALEGIGRAAASRGRMVLASTLFGTASARREALPWPVSPGDEIWHAEVLGKLRAGVDGQTFEAAWSQGRSMSIEEAERFTRQAVLPLFSKG